MHTRFSTVVPSSRRSTRTSTPADASASDAEDIWFICVGCGDSTNSAWGRKPGYPKNSCLDCGTQWMNRSGSSEEAHEDRPANSVHPKPEYRNGRHTALSYRHNTLEKQHISAREASPVSMIVVGPAESEQAEQPGRSSPTLSDSSPPDSLDAAGSIQKLQKLNEDTAAIQREQLRFIGHISGTTDQLLHSRKEDRVRHATLQEENNQLREANERLSADRTDLPTKCKKLETKLRKFDLARLSLMMMEDSDEENQ